MKEPIDGPDQPPGGMREFFREREGKQASLAGRPPETSPRCQHGEHSITCISTVQLLRMDSVKKTLYCRWCNQTWEE